MSSVGPELVAVPMHLDVSGRNSMGAVFVNAELGAVVLRYREFSNAVEMVALAEMAITEVTSLPGQALICDFRSIGAAFIYVRIAVILHLIRSGHVRFLGVVTAPGNHQGLFNPEVHGALGLRGVLATFNASFENVVRWMASVSPENCGQWVCERPPPNFTATYGGSVFSIPGLSCTVIRTAGNSDEFELVAEFFKTGYDLHARTGANVVIMDSSASPPITDLRRYAFTYQNVILPFSTSNNVRTFFHVRAGDALVQGSAPALEPFFRSFGIHFIEVESLTEAVQILRSLRGMPPAAGLLPAP